MMKSTFLRVVALGTVLCASLSSWAQPNLAPPAVVAPKSQPKEADFERAEANADALALLGAFYNKMTRAETYRGRLVVVTTITDKGKVLSQKTVEMESSCIGDQEIQGAFKKDVSKFVVTKTVNGKTTVERLNSVNDGTKNYRFNQTKNIWSEQNQKEGETTWMFDATDGAWGIALAMFSAGRQFEMDNQVVDGKDQIVVRSQPEDEYVFDAKTGDLQSYNRAVYLEGQENYITKVECRWLQHEFNLPLADSIFEWKTPAGAEKVAPEKIDFEDYLQGP